MAALFLDGDKPQLLERSSLANSSGRDEKWLQTLLFQQPSLIVIDQLDPGAEKVVPICRELAIPKENSTVYLDMLGVTPHGRLVLVECKLWRNPQARREVIAQILEYGALLRQWTYSDLTARLKAALSWQGPNPLFEHVRKSVPSLQENRFVDAVERSLRFGDFNLIVAGDGIRSDLQAIASHLNGHGGLMARLGLMEFQLWDSGAGQTLIVPTISLKTQIIEHRVVLDREGAPVAVVSGTDPVDEVEKLIEPKAAQQRDRDRIFWQRFIDTARFEHPDQSPARHGGHNWVRLDLPAPPGWMTVYRTRDREYGLFLRLKNEEGRAMFDTFETEADQLRKETGLPLVFRRTKETPFCGEIVAADNIAADNIAVDDDKLLIWLAKAANRMVNAFRPRLTAMERNAAA